MKAIDVNGDDYDDLVLLEAGGHLSFLWWVCLFFEQQQKTLFYY